MYPKPNGVAKATSLYSKMVIVTAHYGTDLTCQDYFGYRDLEQFPEARNLRPLKAQLQTGDMLYVPICWWHAVQGGDERNQIVAGFYDQHDDKVDKDVAAFGVLRGLELKGRKENHKFPSLWFAWKHLVQCAKDKGIAMCDDE